MNKTTNCFWPWSHQWTKWELYVQGMVDRKTETVFSQDAQKRKCEKCGLEERRDFI